MFGEQFDLPSAGFSQFLGERGPFFFHLIGEKKVGAFIHHHFQSREYSKGGVEQLNCCRLKYHTVVI